MKKILALSWRDINAPLAGGAEVHTHKLLSGLNPSEFEITHFSPEFENCKQTEIIDGVTYIRKGNIFSVIWYAFIYYRKHKDELDYVIDQCNTHRFFTWLYVPRKKRIFYIHQTTREIWKYSMRWPMYKAGQLLETWMLKRNRKDKVITVSQSTKEELIQLGYIPQNIYIVYNGISFAPWTAEQMFEKESVPTFIYAGRYAPYKGIDIAIEAFAALKKKYPDARLWIIGKKDEEYVLKRLKPICDANNITWCDDGDNSGDVVSWGYVSEAQKLELFSRSRALLFPSIREGWGIPITEAGVVGTPSIVFNSPGIRDAVDNGNAGYLCLHNDAAGLLEQMEHSLEDDAAYLEMREKAYAFSSHFNWEKCNDYLTGFWDE